jgi:hypothetical protein
LSKVKHVEFRLIETFNSVLSFFNASRRDNINQWIFVEGVLQGEKLLDVTFMLVYGPQSKHEKKKMYCVEVSVVTSSADIIW